MTNQRLKTPKTCETCSTTFYPFRASTGQFCSNACKFIAKRTPKDHVCIGCQITFQSAKSRPKYCSNPCYQASKRNRSASERLFSQIEKTDTCWLWTGNRSKLGYGRVSIDGKIVFVHRAMYELTTGEDITNKVVRHYFCDNPPCCNPEHLRSGTKNDNSQDMVSRNRHAHGETSYAKLTETDALAIIADSRKHAEIARAYNVARRTVGHIKTGATWKHLPR